MINKDTYSKLRQHKEEHLVSIYIPTAIAGEYEKNKIKWKNAVQQAEHMLSNQNVDHRVVEEILEPAREKYDATRFWEHQSSGLAGFFGKDMNAFVNLAFRPDERVVVSDQFLTYPLLPTLLDDQRVFILALGTNLVKFYEAHPHAIFPLEIEDLVPSGLDDLERQEFKKSLQWHSSIPRQKKAQFHGQAASDEKEDVRLEQFFRFVDKGLQPIFRDEKVPLIIAGLKENQSVYRRISNYKYISDYSIDINPADADAVALHTDIQPFMEEIRQRDIKQVMDQIQFKSSRDLTFSGFNEANEALKMKNIDTLVVYDSQSTDTETEMKKNTIVHDALDQNAEIYFSNESHDDHIVGTKRFKIEEGVTG
ncbi:MAG: hypothetical protein R3275_05960 [Saprospiraceae bacterium]|nr:hypothetical protein [Saprospiraceae bacterium]